MFQKSKFVDDNLDELEQNPRECKYCGEVKALKMFKLYVTRNSFGDKIKVRHSVCNDCMLVNEQVSLKTGYPNRIFSAIKGNCKSRNVEFGLDLPSFMKWYNEAEKTCHYCNRTFEQISANTADKLNSKFKRLSIDRLDNNRGYFLDNIAIACYRCNNIKSNYFTEDEMLEIGKIIHRKELTRGILGNI